MIWSYQLSYANYQIAYLISNNNLHINLFHVECKQLNKYAEIKEIKPVNDVLSDEKDKMYLFILLYSF